MNTQRKVRLSLGDSLKILGPYVYENFFEQLKTIWFIVAYLLLFQILVLGLPIVHAIMIGVGIGIVAFGLMFFMEGLRLGLMPLGETIGAVRGGGCVRADGAGRPGQGGAIGYERRVHPCGRPDSSLRRWAA